MKIQVCDLSKFVTDEILAEAFAKYGTVSSATVVKDKVTGLSKRFGFVEMPNHAEGTAAIKALNHTQLLKVPLRVKEANTRIFTGSYSGNKKPQTQAAQSAARGPVNPPYVRRERPSYDARPIERHRPEFKPGFGISNEARPPFENRRPHRDFPKLNIRRKNNYKGR